MPERSGIYCPNCQPQKVELVRGNPELHVFRCPMNHAFEYGQLEHAEKVPLVFHEKPGPHDVKVEVWVHGPSFQKFREMYPNQINATMTSIITAHLSGEVVIIDGSQAKELRRLGIKNGAEMVAAAQSVSSLEDQLNTATTQLELLRSLISKAGAEIEA